MNLLHTKNALCQVLLKLVQYFWNIFKCCLWILAFSHLSPFGKCNYMYVLLEKGVTLLLNIFKCRQCIFAILLLSYLGKKAHPSVEQTWIPFTKEFVVPSLVVQEKKWKCEKCTTTKTTDYGQAVLWVRSSKPRSDIPAGKDRYRCHPAQRQQAPSRGLNFAALHRQWWRPYMTEIFLNETQSNIQSINHTNTSPSANKSLQIHGRSVY